MSTNADFRRALRRLRVVLAFLAIAAPALVPAGAARAQSNWTCTGSHAASCALKLDLQGCASGSQVCDGSALAFASTGSPDGCACMPACSASADCPGNAACIGEFGGRCTAQFACTSHDHCPRDALCAGGFCRKVTSCGTNADCPRAAPECVAGACVALSAGQCTTDAQCNADPCSAPQRCDAATHRCMATGRAPCDAIAGATCVTEGRAAKCMIPACTSDAQCSSDPCAGSAQKCDLATGRCLPGDPPCADPSLSCRVVSGSPTAPQCIGRRADPPFGAAGPDVDRPDFGDLEIVWGLEPGPGRGGRSFTLVGWLPATAMPDDARPTGLALRVTGADRGIAIDGTTEGKGRSSRWIREAKRGGWRWVRARGDGAIDSVALLPVASRDGRVRVEVRGTTIRGLRPPAEGKGSYAADLAITWSGGRVTRNTAVFDGCELPSGPMRALITCKARPAGG
jgi:hypothetical protein